MRPAPPFRRTSPHSAEQGRRPEPDVAERRGEEGVVLEAVAAAPLVEELALEIVEADADSAAGLDREVLEQERLAVRAVDPFEGGGVRFHGSADADPLQVFSQAHSRAIISASNVSGVRSPLAA